MSFRGRLAFQRLDHLVGDVDARAREDGVLEDDVVLFLLGDLADDAVRLLHHLGELKKMQDELEKNSVTMSETQRRTKEREFGDLNRDFQRRQREFREDLNQHRNEELAQVVEQANRVIRQIAEQEKYDIIFQDAVFASPRIDITDKVIKALEGKPPAK